MRLSGTKATAIHQYRGLGNQLWDLAGNRPSLDLRFAESKSLVDATTGTNLVDFTRASSGTYVGSDGLIKTATTNLLLRSEELTNSVWTSTMSAGVTVTLDNAQGSPYSGTNAYRIDFTAENQNGAQQVFTFIAGIAYFASIWVKGAAGETIRFAGKAGQSAETFTLTGNWQRLLIGPFTATGGSAGFNLNTFGSTTARTVYATAAQLEQSSTVGEYVKTTSTINSAPRFDHDPTTGESLGLLVEESRTNLLLRSEEFETSWTRSGILAFGSGSITDAAIAPNGTTTADLITEDTSVSSVHRLSQGSLTVAAGSNTISIYAKRANGIRNVEINANVLTNARAVFDLGSGTVGEVSSGTASIQSVGNGWYRCSVTGVSAGGTSTLFIQISTGTTVASDTYTGDGTSGIYLWGAQLEAGSFPTSYIPTTTSAFTRAADVASISGSNFSSWYRQDEGTVFAESFADYTIPSGNFPVVSSLTDGTSGNRIENGYLTASLGSFEVFAGGANQASFYPSVAVSRRKIAGAFLANDFAAAINGGTPATDNTGAAPLVNSLTLGSRNNVSNRFTGVIKRLTYWPTRLPNETLQAITQ